MPAYGREGQGQRLFLWRFFTKQKTKFGGGEREGGAGIPFPRTPFSARPARALGGGWECRVERGTKSQRQDFRGNRFGFCSICGASQDKTRKAPRGSAARCSDLSVFSMAFRRPQKLSAPAKCGSPRKARSKNKKVCSQSFFSPLWASCKAIIYPPKADCPKAI